MDKAFDILLHLALFFGLLFVFGFLWSIGHIIVSIMGAGIVYYDMNNIRKDCTKPYIFCHVTGVLLAFPFFATIYTLGRYNNEKSLKKAILGI